MIFAGTWKERVVAARAQEYPLPRSHAVVFSRALWERYIETRGRPHVDPANDADDRMGQVLSAYADAVRELRDNGKHPVRCDGMHFTDFCLHIAMSPTTDWLRSEAPPLSSSGFSDATHRLVMLRAMIGKERITITIPSELEWA